ncbi:MAG TPA: hypothetical protein VGG75_41880 [Trebonia sp.]|jgi:hypothetical protein
MAGEVFHDLLAPFDQRDRISEVLVQAEIAELVDPRQAVRVNVQDLSLPMRSRPVRVELREREGGTRHHRRRAQRGHHRLGEGGLPRGQAALQQDDVPRAQSRCQRGRDRASARWPLGRHGE